jgi:hypothetical protein
MDNPVREIRSIVDDSGHAFTNRVLIGTAVTGLLRVEWVAARYSQIIPMNWSQVELRETLNSYFPLRYQVDDAQNLIVQAALMNDFEWVFFLEHDVCIPDNTFVLLNQYMREHKYPVISGLYYSRSRPSEPLVFRGRGSGVYTDWTLGDKVWVDGVPTGCLLVHHSILKAMYDESPEYIVNKGDKGQLVRRVFNTPRDLWIDPETGNHNATVGTSDLAWCSRVMEGGYLEKAGWKDFAPDARYPFLIDTNLFAKHINMDGEQFP